MGKVLPTNLQSLLQKSMGNEVTVIKYASENLLPKGENYATRIVKIEAVIKRTKTSPEETLNLVGKLIGDTESQESYFDNTASFLKEIFVFHELIPMYRKLQIQCGIKESELINNIVPKFYGSRLSLNPMSENADENCAILMENLKVQGYCMMDKANGFDLEHAEFILKEYAKFTALGVACKLKNAEFFKRSIPKIKVATIRETDRFDDAKKVLKNQFAADPRLTSYKDRITKGIDESSYENLVLPSPESIWSTFHHGDLWVNNILCHHDENNKIDGVKFIDFTIVNYCSVMKDLPYFLFTSCNSEVVDKQTEYLLDLYYYTFIDVLKKMNCDTNVFTKESFDEMMKFEARQDFFHCLIDLTLFANPIDDLDVNLMISVLRNSPTKKLFEERAYKGIKKFADLGWL